MDGKENRWIRIAGDISEIHFGDNNMAVVIAGGKEICVGKMQDALFAFASRCPHAGGLLHEGCITGSGEVICPVHGYKFNIRNGYNVSGEGYYLRHWAVVVKSEGIFVCIEE